MSDKKKRVKLTPFEQNKINIKEFHENMKMCESAALLMEAAIALNITSSEANELCELEDMLVSTIVQFSEFLESRGDEWN
mgnify:CR=1 FL=1